MATTLTKTIPYQPQDNSIVVALDEPDGSLNVWLVTVKAKIGTDFQRVGAQFETIAPGLSLQGGERVIALASLAGVTEWQVTAVTAANAQPGSLEVTAGPEALNVPPPLYIVEGVPVPVPPLPVAGPQNIAYVATAANGGNNATAEVGNITRPFSTFAGALSALGGLPVGQRPPVIMAAGGVYNEVVNVGAGAPLNGLVMIADGEVTVDSTGIGDALVISGATLAECQAFQSFTMQGKWILRASGANAINIQGLPDPTGSVHMGDAKVGGIQLRGVWVRDGNLIARYASTILFDDVQFFNVAPIAEIENVSQFIVKNGSRLPDIEHTYDPTVDFDTLAPSRGLLVEAGSEVQGVRAIGASKVRVEKGCRMAALNATAWAVFVSAAPAFDESPAIVVHGEANGNHTFVCPDEGASATATVVDYEQAAFNGNLTGSKVAGASRIAPQLGQGGFSGLLDFTGLLDVDLKKAKYSPTSLATAGGATVDQSSQEVTANSAAGAVVVPLPHAFPAGITDYTVSAQPNAVGGFAADPFFTLLTETDFTVTATAVVSFTFTITRNGGL